ncbi:MAG: PTS lactose/cellobiose transporter subunit IIA [Atopobiaceae bacterium]
MADENVTSEETAEPDMEEACFQIISTVGCAKSNYIEAINKAKEFKFDEAADLIKQGNETYLQGHNVHMGLLQEDAEKMGSTKVPLLLVHAEDQLMQAETFRVFAEDMLDVYQKLQQK